MILITIVNVNYFLKDKCFNVTMKKKSFILGYYSHLWLDNYLPIMNIFLELM